MNIFGLDFTSNPKNSKTLTLACCRLEGKNLKVLKLEQLNPEGEKPFKGYEKWLDKEHTGFCESSDEWIAGIDFPFGMPVMAIEYFEWLSNNQDLKWCDYIDKINGVSKNDVTLFQKIVGSWKKHKNTKAVHLLRFTDYFSRFDGCRASSPMKVKIQHRPSVGRMFFEGAIRLKKSGVCVYPVHITDDKRIVVEAYPALVASYCIKNEKYKDGKDTKEMKNARNKILERLSQSNAYKIILSFDQENNRKECIEDNQGDVIDSILCAVQAAWAYQEEQEQIKQVAQEQTEQGQTAKKARINNYGVPNFTNESINSIVKLEGWIVDPLLLRSVRSEKSPT